MTTNYNSAQRGSIRGSYKLPKKKAAAAINPERLVEITSGNIQQAQSGSRLVYGATRGYIASGEWGEAWAGPNVVKCESPVLAGQNLQAGISGQVMPMIDAENTGDLIDTSSVGIAFTNQPANDGVEVVSSNAADTTQIATIYGTTTATDTVVVEAVTLNGTTQVDTVKVDWGQILGITLSAAALGTVTFREASANATIKAFTAGQTSHGLDAVTGTTAYTYNVAPTIEGDGASTKQVGLIGTNAAGTTIYDSQALSGTAAQTMNTAFNTVTHFLTGDLEGTVVALLRVGAVQVESVKVGKALEPQATAGGIALCNITP